MAKFKRNYLLSIGPTTVGGVVTDPTVLEIEPPFTMEFDISRNTLASVNTANFRIYNLSQDNRKKVAKDAWQTNVYMAINLKAGYGENLSTIFKGNIRHAWSVRESVNFITTTDCFDGGDAVVNSKTVDVFKKGATQASILRSTLTDLKNTKVGTIGNFPGTIPRGNAVNGNSAELANILSNGGFFIDLETAHCLNDNECLRGSIDVINSATGLLGTPIREQQTLTFDILFEPRILVGQKILLDSSTGSNFNGFYKVISLKHKGMISEAVCGDAVTSLGLWTGSKELLTVGV